MNIVKSISSKNKQMKVKYDHRHVIETVNSFWQYVYFTDEAHFDSDKFFAKRMLREESTRYEAAMINEKRIDEQTIRNLEEEILHLRVESLNISMRFVVVKKRWSS